MRTRYSGPTLGQLLVLGRSELEKSGLEKSGLEKSARGLCLLVVCSVQ